jgi:hypothetical protein
MLEAMYRPYDVHRALRCVGFQLAGLLVVGLVFVGLVCLPACGDRVVVVRELSLQPEPPDAAASAPDAGSHRTLPPRKHDTDDKDDKPDLSHR